MREIKFRAWIENRKLMGPVLAIRFSREGVYQVNMKDETGFEWQTGAILLQFTGLTDRHGKEIYEGDILKLDGGGEQEPLLPVEWNPTAAQWSVRAPWLKDGPQPLVPLEAYIDMPFCKVEILGNLYEHPHLLQARPTPGG